ncbi:piggyBac transposable element-derived protein 3-like [Photinus pyralis]|uniref:piggyBac transposable element-derived protein 3-like n=1 Tax=Photinus pyralis TaxID=7054 RepID=UPI001266E8CF|nr:piggyBac transposable element-derived protein 3-like [Photinus pyralis]
MANSNLPNDVPGKVELHYPTDDESSDEIPSGEEEDSDDNVPLSILFPKKSKSSKIAEETPKWTKTFTDISMTERTTGYEARMEKMVEAVKNDNPVQTFERMFDDKVIKLIVEQSNIYALQKNRHGFSVSGDEIKTFLGVLLLSGYHRLPREPMYWSDDEDVSVPFVASSISRNRFQEIKRFLHIADNSKLDKTDKMYKLRPLMNLLNENFRQWGILHQNFSIDEAMVKYFEHHSGKQFIRGKPVRFGFKNWMICSSTGYCYKYDTYCGAKVGNAGNNSLPLGSRVVLELLQCVDQPSDHIMFCDNFFSSYNLMKTLKGMKIRATGTVRENRTKKCPLSSVKQMQKMERGVFEKMYDMKNNLLFVRWKDNSVVTMVTNYDTVEPLETVKR